MTIQERLKRSNLIMLVVPVAIAGVLLAIGLGLAVARQSVLQMGGTQNMHTRAKIVKSKCIGFCPMHLLFVFFYAMLFMPRYAAGTAQNGRRLAHFRKEVS